MDSRVDSSRRINLMPLREVAKWRKVWSHWVGVWMGFWDVGGWVSGLWRWKENIEEVYEASWFVLCCMASPDDKKYLPNYLYRWIKLIVINLIHWKGMNHFFPSFSSILVSTPYTPLGNKYTFIEGMCTHPNIESSHGYSHHPLSSSCTRAPIWEPYTLLIDCTFRL